MTSQNTLPTVRMGLIGLGHMGRHHARVIRETTGMTLVAVADPGGDPFGAAAGLPVLPDVQSLVNSGIDAAIVAVPTAHHETVALQLAAAGIHTMVEKPIAHDAEAGHRIADAFDNAGLVGAVGYVERCNPAILEMRRRLRQGQLGEIFQITTSRQSPFPARIEDVGVVKDLATHDLDLTAWIADATYKSIHAEVTYRSGRKYEDMVVASGRMSNGIVVNHTVNWLSPFKDRRTTVIGEKGAFVADTAVSDLTYFASGSVDTTWDTLASFRGPSEGDITRYAFPKPEPLALEHLNFLAAIRGEKSDVVTMREGVETLRVIDRLFDSVSQDGTRVSAEDLPHGSRTRTGDI